MAEGALVMMVPVAHLLGVLTVGQVYVVALLSATRSDDHGPEGLRARTAPNPA